MSKFENDIAKQVGLASGTYRLNDQTSLVQFGQLKPDLLTMLLGVEEKHFSTTNFQWDRVTSTNQLPAGKSYSSRGPDIGKDQGDTVQFLIGSKGWRLNVAPGDYAERRKPGTQDFLTEADVLASLNIKNQVGWDLNRELDYLSILTTDKNRPDGSGVPEYDFYSELAGGSARSGTKLPMALATASADHKKLFGRQKRVIAEEALKAGLSVSGYMCICGDEFFDKIYTLEQRSTVARELRTDLDLLVQQIPTITSNGIQYDNFKASAMGINFIRYSGKIGASANIGVNDAYLLPILSNGDSMVKVGYAPSQHRDHVNKQAQSMYSWEFVDGFQGVTAYFEQNALVMNLYPKLIVHLETN